MTTFNRYRNPDDAINIGGDQSSPDYRIGYADGYDGNPHQEQYKDAEGRIQPNYYDGYIDGMVSLELAQEDYITELAGRGPEFDPEGNDWEGFLNAVDDRAFLFLSEAVHQIEIYIPENIVAEVSTNA